MYIVRSIDAHCIFVLQVTIMEYLHVKVVKDSSKELFRKTSAIIVKKMGTATLTNSRETIASTVVSKDAQQLE